MDNELTIGVNWLHKDRLVGVGWEYGDDIPVKDIIEVTSQAVKNYDWLWQTEKMTRRMLERHSERSKNGAGRFFVGSPILLKKLVRLSKEFRKSKNEVFVVQPGVSFNKMTPQMNSILGSADSYLRVRAGAL